MWMEITVQGPIDSLCNYVGQKGVCRCVMGPAGSKSSDKYTLGSYDVQRVKRKCNLMLTYIHSD